MPHFLTIRQHGIVDLPEPWDPERALRDYENSTGEVEQVALTPWQLDTLTKDGLLVRIDALHRWLGSLEGEMRVSVETPTRIEVEIGGSASVVWWLWPFALLVRPFLRRRIEAQMAELIMELQTEVEPDAAPPDEAGEEPVGELAPAPRTRAQSKNLAWRIQISTTAGDLIYKREHLPGVTGVSRRE